MNRRLFSFVPGVSMLLCIAFAALAVRSYWRLYCGEVDVGQLRTTFAVHVGGVRLEMMQRFPWSNSYLVSGDGLANTSYFRVGGQDLPAVLTRLGFEWRWSVLSGGFVPPRHFLTLIFPIWFLAAIAAVIPACWVVRWRYPRIGRAGDVCRRCGYDQRATPNRCPECGEVPAQR